MKAIVFEFKPGVKIPVKMLSKHAPELAECWVVVCEVLEHKDGYTQGQIVIKQPIELYEVGNQGGLRSSEFMAAYFALPITPQTRKQNHESHITSKHETKRQKPRRKKRKDSGL